MVIDIFARLPCECSVMYESEQTGVATAFWWVANDPCDSNANGKNTL
jgi:hypothetical protein